MPKQRYKDPSEYIRAGRRRKNPPKDAAARVQELAKEGYSIKGIAARLGAGVELFSRWRDENPDIQHALDEGREHEHSELFNSLYGAAKKGNVVAAIFLLKTRHGYREGAEGELANRVTINFQLPGALPLDQFKVIEHEPDSTEPVPAKTAVATRRA